MKNEVKENTQKKENIEYKAQIRKVCPMCEREVILRLDKPADDGAGRVSALWRTDSGPYAVPG